MSENLKEYESGMLREDKSGLERFSLMFPISQKYRNTMIAKFAKHLSKGAGVHGDRNWEKASGKKELSDFRDGAWRHFVKFMCGETDEDHASGTLFNMNGAIYLMDKLKCDIHGNDLIPVQKEELDLIERFEVVLSERYDTCYKYAEFFKNINVYNDSGKSLIASIDAGFKKSESVSIPAYNVFVIKQKEENLIFYTVVNNCRFPLFELTPVVISGKNDWKLRLPYSSSIPF